MTIMPDGSRIKESRGLSGGEGMFYGSSRVPNVNRKTRLFNRFLFKKKFEKIEIYGRPFPMH